jgi:hypothetical protein
MADDFSARRMRVPQSLQYPFRKGRSRALNSINPLPGIGRDAFRQATQ